MIILEVITFIIILFFYNPINQVKEQLLKTYLPFIVIDSIISKATKFKEVKGEIANGSMLLRDDVLFSESIQEPLKLDRLRNSLCQQSDFQKGDEHSEEGTIYKINKSTSPGKNRTLVNVGWINEYLESLSLSIENANISAATALRVDVRQAAERDKKINSSWSGITSDFIPINNHTHYNYSLAISAKDVDNLHSIVCYYDSRKNGIKEDYIFHRSSGSFKREINNVFLSPIEAKYVKIQFWLRPSIGHHSNYLLNNIAIAEIPTWEMQYKSVPTIKDPELKIEIVTPQLEFPTSMTFLGPDDILVLEKNKGTVKRIVNGSLLPNPLLDVNVGTLNDRGMLGIAASKSNDIFVYFTETSTKDGSDIIGNVMNENYKNESEEPLGNRLYKYKFHNDTLTSSKLLIDIPATIIGEKNKGLHNGGKVIIGPDDNVYLVVGDIGRFRTKTQNVLNSFPLNATSVILRISQEGEAIGNILGTEDPISKFYAYGIRNSFGMDFDPVTGYLWDTENGDKSNDEINLINPGFNSGWSKIMGMRPEGSNPDLVNFRGNGKYSDPEFVWANHTVGVTALKFLDSDKLGKKYKFDMFVGDFNNGYLYHFDLDEKRTELMFDDVLKDKIANNRSELKNIVFAEGFGGITDIAVGPDGYLYVLALRQTNPQSPLMCADIKIACHKYSDPIEGALFRIVPLQ